MQSLSDELYFVKYLQRPQNLLRYLYMKSKQIHNISCPTAKVAALLSDLWTILIIRDLLGSPKRFSELQTSLDGVSSRTLTLKLARLEEYRILDHKGTSYQLTANGKKLHSIIAEMNRVGKKLR